MEDEAHLDFELKEQKPEWKDKAIQVAHAWSDEILAHYIEPTRRGTPKGDPIGFSRRKLQAAHLMVLHPTSLSLPGIAKLSGVSPGMARVWREEPAFRKAIEEFGLFVAGRITRSIEHVIKNSEIQMLKAAGGVLIQDGVVKILKSQHDRAEAIAQVAGKVKEIVEIDDTTNEIPEIMRTKDWKLTEFEALPLDVMKFYVAPIPHFNRLVAKPFLEWLLAKLNTATGYSAALYSTLTHVFMKEITIQDVESWRKWQRGKENLPLIKALIQVLLDLLAKPEQLKPKEAQRAAEMLRGVVFNTFEDLRR